jgi:sarcosine/dimethylglycine N-methyltransferase
MLNLKMIVLYNSTTELKLQAAIMLSNTKKDQLTLEDLKDIDMLHYNGTEDLDAAIQIVKRKKNIQNFQPSDIFVDVGSGLGGPARYIAVKHGCNVIGLEYQLDHVEASRKITDLLKKNKDLEKSLKNITFVHGDATASGDEAHFFDGAVQADYLVSQLAFLHIRNKKAVFRNCARILKTGGMFIIEDYVWGGSSDESLTQEEKVIQKIMEESVSIPDGKVSTREEYERLLLEQGLQVDEWIEKTESWALFIWNRCETYLNQPNYGGKLANFFAQVARLFPLPESKLDKYPLSLNKIFEISGSRKMLPNSLRGAIIIGHKQDTMDL